MNSTPNGENVTGKASTAHCVKYFCIDRISLVERNMISGYTDYAIADMARSQINARPFQANRLVAGGVALPNEAAAQILTDQAVVAWAARKLDVSLPRDCRSVVVVRSRAPNCNAGLALLLFHLAELAEAAAVHGEQIGQ